MFCQNCGKRVKESWAVCPNCGCKILERDDVVSEERDYHLFGMRRTGRFTFWKIPTIIKVKGDSIHAVLTIKVMFTLSRQSGFYSLYLLSNTFLSLSHKIPIARPHPF